MIYGVIITLLAVILFFVILLYFRPHIERGIEKAQDRIESHQPKLKGYIIVPEDELEISRKEIIERNKKLGKPTHIDELREK